MPVMSYYYVPVIVWWVSSSVCSELVVVLWIVVRLVELWVEHLITCGMGKKNDITLLTNSMTTAKVTQYGFTKFLTRYLYSLRISVIITSW